MKAPKIKPLRLVLLAILCLFLLLPSCILWQQVQEKEKQSFSFAFLTDIHVMERRSAGEGFAKAIDTVNGLDPNFVLTGGDLILDALGQNEETAESYYRLYNTVSKSFAMPVYNTIGNHDIFGIYEESGVDPSHPLYGKKMYEKRIGKRFYAFNHKGWRFYILDSIGIENGKYFGHVGDTQLAWLKEDLKSVPPTTPIAISVHIPMITTRTQLLKGAREANKKGLVIDNSKEVLAIFRHHNVKLVLQGHLHLYEDIYAKEIHFITGGSVASAWWGGPREGMEEGFMMLHVEGDDITSEYIDYGWHAKK